MRSIEKIPFNRNTRKMVEAAIIVSTAVSALAAFCSGWFLWRLIRCMNTVQRTLPTVEKASALYLKKNGGSEDDISKSK